MKSPDPSRAAHAPLAPRPLLAASAAALLLSSCASFNDIETSARMRTPSEYATSVTIPEQGGQWPDLSWTESIGGAPLQSVINEALADNPGLQIAAARVAAARALAHAASAAARPSIGAAFSSTYQRYSENYIFPPPLAGQFESDNQLTLNFSYDFDFWNKHAAELRAALSEGRAAEAEEYAARLVLTTAIARAWIQMARQYAQSDLTEQQLMLWEKIDHLTQLRVAAGLDTQSEIQQARQQLAGLHAEAAQWKEAIALTRNQLAALIGQGPDRGQRIARPDLPPQAAAALPDALPLGLLGRRPDIVAARWRVEAAQGEIERAKTQFYPNVNLIAFAGFSSLGLSNLLQTGSRMAGIGPAIRLPIFEGGGLQAQLKGKVAAYDAAVATYNQVLTDALHEVADQVQSLRAAETRSVHYVVATQAAAANLKLAQQRERVGTSNVLPVLSSEMAWLMQRKVELDAQARRSDLRIALIKALGGGFEAAARGLDPASIDNSSRSNHSTNSKSAS